MIYAFMKFQSYFLYLELKYLIRKCAGMQEKEGELISRLAIRRFREFR